MLFIWGARSPLSFVKGDNTCPQYVERKQKKVLFPSPSRIAKKYYLYLQKGTIQFFNI